MIQSFCIYEYGIILRGGDAKGCSVLSISESDWDWLLRNEVTLETNGPQLFQPVFYKGQHVLRVANYVGVITLPSGDILEIIPKVADEDDVIASRKCLLKMLFKVNDLPFAHFNEAELSLQNKRFPEIIIAWFLRDAQRLVNHGLRSQYAAISGEEAYLKGKLKLSDHIRQPPHKRTRFPVEYDEYILDRPENRLLHWAIYQVFMWTQDYNHKNHARKLLSLLSSIPISRNPLMDLNAWEDIRLMQHYRHAKPWISMFIKKQAPWTQAGGYRGLSMLFPMELLFERYVFTIMKERVHADCTMRSQSHIGWLAEHNGGKKWFKLCPDLAVYSADSPIYILDTKWKMIDGQAVGGKYSISQADMYQLFAYGQKGLPSGGSLFLLYPKHKKFNAPLPCFEFSDRHKLWVVPFCMETDTFIEGDWCNFAPYVSHMARMR